MNVKLKKHETIGCCGIDCGLCPRYYTKGESACPGCGGFHFTNKHPACGYLTCCVAKHGSEVCAECKEYPCKRFDAERAGYDSFVTHRKIFDNQEIIRKNGIEHFSELQKQRMDVLHDMLDNYDDGRSKNFYCLSCALLPIDKLQEALEFARSSQFDNLSNKEKSKIIKDSLQLIASNLNIELKLIKKN